MNHRWRYRKSITRCERCHIRKPEWLRLRGTRWRGGCPGWKRWG